MRDFAKDDAERILRIKYWNHRRMPLQPIARWHEPVALELFDTAVNMGVETSARFLQKALNALNRNATLFPDLKVDGWAGALTRGGLRKLRKPIDRSVLLQMLNSQQGSRYMAIMARYPDQEEYARGWFYNRVAL